MQDLEGEAAGLVEEAVDLAGLDLEVAIPELVQLVLDDGLAWDRELNGASARRDVGVDLDALARHIESLLLLAGCVRVLYCVSELSMMEGKSA